MNKESIEIHALLEEIALKNSEDALRLLYLSYYKRILRLIHLYVKSEEISREIVSDVFMSIWENRNGLLLIDNFDSYIYKIAKYKSFNHLRSNKINTINIEDISIELFAKTQTTPEDNYISDETISQINKAIEELPPKCQLAFKLIREDNLKYKDAAQILGVSVKTIENHLTLAIKKIRSRLK